MIVLDFFTKFSRVNMADIYTVKTVRKSTGVLKMDIVRVRLFSIKLRCKLPAVITSLDSTTGYNQSVTGCVSQRKHVVVTQRKLMLTNTSFPASTCHLEKNTFPRVGQQVSSLFIFQVFYSNCFCRYHLC